MFTPNDLHTTKNKTNQNKYSLYGPTHRVYIGWGPIFNVTLIIFCANCLCMDSGPVFFSSTHLYVYKIIYKKYINIIYYTMREKWVKERILLHKNDWQFGGWKKKLLVHHNIYQKTALCVYTFIFSKKMKNTTLIVL